MAKTFTTEFAICSDGRCDLSGLPCLRALNIARQMAGASAQLGAALPETFGLEADIEVPGCLRPCRLSVTVANARVAVSYRGRPLASVDLPDMTSSAHGPSVGGPAIAAVGWRAH